jgi:hypothetical protein
MTKLLRIAKPSVLTDPVTNVILAVQTKHDAGQVPAAGTNGLSAVDSATSAPVVIAEASEQLVCVAWIDSWVSGATWEPRGVPDLDFGEVISVGFLVWFTDQWVVISSSLSEDQQGGVQRIPRSTIVSLTLLDNSVAITRPKR